MKQISRILLPVLILTAVLAGGVLSATAQQPGQATAPEAANALLGYEFTYQGKLENNGSPANGSFDFEFKLFDAAASSTQVGTTLARSGVAVSQGYFTVQLNFGSPFTGTALWLEIAVRTAGGGVYTPLLPRQALNAAPYALGLVPGASIQGAIGNLYILSAQNTTGHAIEGVAGGGGRGVVGRSNTGTGVYGYASGVNQSTKAVMGENDSTSGIGVAGYANAGQGQTVGVSGTSYSPDGFGVRGFNSAASGKALGVFGESISLSGIGVWGEGNVGVQGRSIYPDGYGVSGAAVNPSGVSYGVAGISFSTTGVGVSGYTNATSGVTKGVIGWSDSSSGVGVYGYNPSTNGTTYGVYGQSESTSGYAIYGLANATSGNTIGVFGGNKSPNGVGVAGLATSVSGVTAGVTGRSESPLGYGIYGTNVSTLGWAAWFDGKVRVNGTLTKTAGSFQIDHPLDPANQYLYHSFVESPDMKNIYDGVVVLDSYGEATVVMPDWFQALNGDAQFQSDYRYQLTPIGAAMPNLYIAQKIAGNTFRIAGGVPGMEVSRQVTGIRHDPYAEANRIPVEAPKPPAELGTYLFPALYGQPDSAGVNYTLQQAMPAALDAPDMDLRLPR